MHNPKIKFESLKDKINYISHCEKSFELEVSNAISSIVNHKSLKLLYVCGPSCSGKTTSSNMIISRLTELGKMLEVISVDDYYLNRECIIENCTQKGIPIDFESISSLDFALLKNTIDNLKDEKENIQIPCFDFKAGKRIGMRNIKNTEDTLILFEGIQTVYPEIRELFLPFECEGIRIGIFEDILASNKTISKNDMRLIRRIVRDVSFRNTPALETLSLWQSVRNNEITNIDPYIENAKIKINSFHAYELSALRCRAIKLLSTVPENSEHYEKAMELTSALLPFEDIDSSFIPESSLLREFLQ